MQATTLAIARKLSARGICDGASSPHVACSALARAALSRAGSAGASARLRGGPSQHLGSAATRSGTCLHTSSGRRLTSRCSPRCKLASISAFVWPAHASSSQAARRGRRAGSVYGRLCGHACPGQHQAHNVWWCPHRMSAAALCFSVKTALLLVLQATVLLRRL
jgi:hypothetical protein